MVTLCFVFMTLGMELPNGSPLDAAFLSQSKSFFSDFPDLAKIFWSRRIHGPCGTKVGQDGFLIPCSSIPATPREFPYPSGKILIYQNLTYQPPLPSRKQASLSVSYHIRFISLGIVWDFLIDSRGISEALFLVQYDQMPGRLEIAPGIYIRVKNLRPARIIQVNKSATGNFSFRKHNMEDWAMPSAFFNQSMFYDEGSLIKCGCPVRVLKSLPAEAVNAIMSLVDDSGDVLPGDVSTFYFAEVGTNGCGEVPYLPWFRHMTHRDPEFPIKEHNGIPVQWLKLGEPRDPGDYSHEVVEGHGKTDQVKEALAGEGYVGEVLEDATMQAQLDALSTSDLLDKNLTSAEVGEMVFALVDIIEGQGLSELSPLVEEFLGNILEDPNHHDDTTIHFNPRIESELPFYPPSFYSGEPPANTEIRRQIRDYPYTPFTLGRLLLHDDFWRPYSDHELYRKGMLRARALEDRNINIRLRENQVKQAALTENLAVLGQVQEDLESVTASNGNSQEIVYQVPRYDRCHDPSQVAVERVIFGDLVNILTDDNGCGLLIRIIQ